MRRAQVLLKSDEGLALLFGEADVDAFCTGRFRGRASDDVEVYPSDWPKYRESRKKLERKLSGDSPGIG